MSEPAAGDLFQTVRTAIQDLVAPELREIKVRLDALEKLQETQCRSLQSQNQSLYEIQETQYQSLQSRYQTLRQHQESQYRSPQFQYQSLREHQDSQYKAVRDQQDAHFQALMAAIHEFKAKSELDTLKMITALSERVAVLEAARH